tara:strand:+ start:25159 stop:41367 length:16209 start_codon:yes stop_codon:yes gene_type:complete
MTLRKPHISSPLDQSASGQSAPDELISTGRGTRGEKSRLRDRLRRKRRENRHALIESLETRQLLAGPDLIGIQPNEGSLLQDGTQLTVSPRELVFQFDDNANIDPDTLSALRITRAGEDRVFESATATSDLGTSSQVLFEFRAQAQGSVGNGIQVQFEVSDRPNNPTPIITVSDRIITIDVNSSDLSPTRASDLVSAVNNNDAANDLIEIIQVSGPSQGVVGKSVQDGLVLTLDGANAAQAVTDFGTNGAVQVRLVSQLPGADGRGIVVQVDRQDFGGPANPVIVVTDRNIRIQLNRAVGNETTAAQLINAINNNPDASSLLSASLEQGSGNTLIGNRGTSYSPLSLSGVSDVVVEPGFVGLGDSPREVVFRFAEPLPDDNYQIDILGSGPLALLNVDGEAFMDGVSETLNFSINLGPQVLAVVPEPVRRNADGSLSPATGKIEVHFNDDDLEPSLATNPAFYQLVYTRDTVSNAATATAPADAVVTPTSVQYNSITNIVTLDFGRPLSRMPDTVNPGQFLTGAARLRVGTSDDLPAPPTEIAISVDAGDSFDTSVGIDLTSQQSVRLSGEIFNTSPFELELPGPNLPGTRNIRPDDPTRLTRSVPLDYLRNAADTVDGISVVQYNFASSWLGDDPSRQGIVADTTYTNVITEQQRQRVREVLTLYSEYLGINFVEVEGSPTSDAFFSIAVGDLYGGDERVDSGQGGIAVVTRDRDLDGIDDLAVMDFQDFDESIDDQFGGEFFRGAMFAVGQLLGYGYADDLPQPVSQSTDFIFTPGSDNEASFPSPADIVHGQYLYRPDSTDIDLYRFTLQSSGKLSVETIAERLGAPSLLDSALRLYREDGNGSFVEIAQNDDYFSNDSLIEMDVAAGNYVIGVSANGNNSYDPSISGTGFGGRSEGEYELRIDFRPNVTNSITDTTGVALDGDADNRPGGLFDFWFLPADANNTIYVDKAASGASGNLLGTIGNPYREIDQAIAAASPGDTIRVIGNGGADGRIETLADNLSYHIGFASNGVPLEDGSSLDLPQGVHMTIDSGAVLKMSRSRLGVGSVSPLIDASDTSLQVLGTPTIIGANGLPARDSSGEIIPGSVYFTSINDDAIGGGNAPAFTPAPGAGDWGGIDFRGDLDAADEQRRNRENEGVFLNHIQFADMRYGGGSVSIGGRQVVVSPIDMATTRPTIINSSITESADAAIAATPDSFAETRFTSSFFQGGGEFTPDYSRIGPEIHGNHVTGNSINGLFVRLVTRTGDVLETITQSTRFDDTDIPHVLTENLVIEGTAGGPIIQSSAPSSLLVRFTSTPTGNVPAGTYVYRLTNVDQNGLESAASQATVPFTLTDTGGIILNQLPTVGAGNDFTGRNLYRATVDPATQLPGPFTLVQNLNSSDTTFVDRASAGTIPLSGDGAVLRSRLDASLVIDPGTVIKIDGARIEARFGANLIAEGTPGVPIIFTSLEDQRYGGGGTFDTNERGGQATTDPNEIRGDWGGIYVGHGSSASLDNVVVAGAGGTTRIEGGFASFNAIEVHQAELRLANSTLEYNADGRGDPAGDRVGRGENAAGSVFVRAATPIIVGNNFANSDSAALTFDLNSLNSQEVNDPGRSTGGLDRVNVVGNTGPLIQNNSLTNNAINGMQVRGGQLVTGGVWDDVDIVHVVTDTIEIPNQHINGGLRLRSDARGSLVVKFENGEDTSAGIVVGGSLLTAADQLRDIRDRIGGSLQIIGHPDFPVVLTALADDTAGAGFTRDGRPQVDTNNDGIAGTSLGDQSEADGFAQLPAGPEVDRGLTIDNDVNVNTIGYFEATPQDGHLTTSTGVTVLDSTTGQVAVNQNYFFDFATYVLVGNTVTRLSATTITQPATLVGEDIVESQGTFAGQNGTINWTAQTTFRDGVAVMFSSLEMESADGSPLGDVRIANFFHPDVGIPGQENLYLSGTPGNRDFRAVTYQIDQRFGFGHGGYYVDDGQNLVNATYLGFAADTFANLETDIAADAINYTVAGTIDQVTLPPIVDPNIGQVFGTGDVNTAFAWQVDADSTSATVTSFVELIEQASAITNSVALPQPGAYNGIVIREAAHDRNVAAIAEQEPVRTAVVNTNSIPSQSQFLGEIAPNEQSGDENRRLGFIVDGAITTKDDIDVYSFVAESGTEVWLDIDRTGNSLDSVIELIDANGQVLAASNDSLLAEDPNNQTADGRNLAIFANTARGLNPDAAQPLSVVAERLAAQQITISGSIANATGGNLTLSIDGETQSITVPVNTFLSDPASAIATALETLSSQADVATDLGNITGSLLRRSAGGDFVIQLQFDPDLFVGRRVPTIQISTVAITGATATSSVEDILLGSQIQDQYSSNPKDAGMRIVLPGESNTRNLYHIRVRSSNTRDGLDLNALVNGDVRGGLTSGRYELQVRLQEDNETAGTQVSLADVRYATNGIQIIGQPFHSPLLGEEYETDAANDSLANAQPLGPYGLANDAATVAAIATAEADILAAQAAIAAATTTAQLETARQQLAVAQTALLDAQAQISPLQSDQLAKSFAGVIDSATDVDWYRFEIRYDNLTRDNAALYLSTVFDLDYADNFARSDMALYVFNAAGQLILVGGDSNIADDLPGSATGNDSADLSRGSADTGDPYIGAAELIEGTYYVAVSNQRQVPLPLDQFFNAGSANPLLRLEPIDSVTRIAEDHINSFGGGTASLPIVPVLFDENSIVDYTLGDVNLYVNTGTSLVSVNPFTGDINGTIGNFSDEIEEIAFRSNGELFSYSGFGQRQQNDTNWFYYRIDTSDASLSAPLSAGAGITTFEAVRNVDPTTGVVTTQVVPADTGYNVDAITIAAQGGLERGFFVGDRTLGLSSDALQSGARYDDNVLYAFAPESGLATGPTVVFQNGVSGAATSPREVGKINTDPADDPNVPLGTVLTELPNVLGFGSPATLAANGIQVPNLVDGDRFIITEILADGTPSSVTFEFNSGINLSATGSGAPIIDGQTVTVDGNIFEFETGQRLVLSDASPLGALGNGSTVQITGDNGETVTAQFVQAGGVASTGNVAISLVDGTGAPRTSTSLASELAGVINSAVSGVQAIGFGGEVLFNGTVTPTIAVAGGGIATAGNNGTFNPGAIAIAIPDFVSADQLISQLEVAIRAESIAATAAGTLIAFPLSGSVTLGAGPASTALPPLSVGGDASVAPDNVEVFFQPTDSTLVIGQRIIDAIDNDTTLLNVTAGRVLNATRSIEINGASFSGQSASNGALTLGGNRRGGQVTGIEVVNGGNLYAVTDAGELYVVPGGQLNGSGARGIGTLVDSATDLLGINFTGLRSGPISYNDGELRSILFGITGNGDIYAFNTLGELQPIFAGGQSMISTGIAGAQGLDFSTLGYNLWHTTNQRGDDPGHGINALPNGARGGASGGNSLAFSFEGGAFNGNYPSNVERPSFFARQDGAVLEDTYNLPGGAKGVIESNNFSLEGVASGDQPTLYFNYFANNDGTNDRLRVYVINEAGVEHLVASNNTTRQAGLSDDEFDDPSPVGAYADDIDVDVQQLFDNTGTWRQARVPLGEFAGESNLSLRIEYSTNGLTETQSTSIRTVAGDMLVEGQQLVVNGEVFTLDFAPTIAVPGGVELAAGDPANLATIVVNDQDYVLTAGPQTVGAGQIAVDLLDGTFPGTTVAELSADQVAQTLAAAIRLTPPPNPVVTGVFLSDEQDDPANTSGGRNDLIYQATPLPYEGGNLRIEGTGRLGNVDLSGTTVNIDDVDLLRVNVQAGTTIGVDADLVFNASQSAAVRFFDANGNELINNVTVTNGREVLTVAEDGFVYIGISGLGNESYDPRIDGTAQPGQVDSYTATIDINVPLNILVDGNAIEMDGISSVDATPDSLFQLSGQSPIQGTPISISRFMSAAEVADQVRGALADRFTGGDDSLLPGNGSTVRLSGLTLNNPGPFADTGERYGDQYGVNDNTRAAVAASGNDFEGIYLDDFIIGFAERGELATSSNAVVDAFVADERRLFPQPDDPISNLTTGSYQVEIRDASEYVASGVSSQFRTFDTNQRLTDSRSITARGAAEIQDGLTFTINDGRSVVTFEFDLVESATSVQPGNVQIPFTLQFADPVTGQLRPQTAAEVAVNIIDAINRADVQSVIDVPALAASGVDTKNDATINLFGEVVITDPNNSLASINRESLRGDDNRDRDGQGVILIENSRFLFNDQYGLNINHGLTANVDGTDTETALRYPRNLVELNTESLVPGVVVQSNVLAYNGLGGLQIEGIDSTISETISDPLPFERIVNNTIIGGTVSRGAESPSATFEGILFDQGLISFADVVTDFQPDAGGSPPSVIHQDASTALGAPDCNGRGPEPADGQFSVSIGLGGSLTVQFTDNLLTGSGDSRPDLIIFETGAVESVRVEISRDGLTFFDVGIVGGLTNTVDLDAFGFGSESRFSFVRVTDLRQGDTTGAPLGADIDAIGALSTVSVENFTAGGTGINIVGNAAPALLNNVIANSEQGIEVDAANDTLLLGGNAFYRNTSNVPTGVSLGEFPLVLTDSEAVFVSASGLVFAPAAGASIIDSSIDSVEDRPSLTTVKNPLGLPPSPILAPRLDVNGQLRVDDPNVETPSGLGERVFKDRGASDRGDQTGPRVVLLSPQAPNLGLDAGRVTVLGSAPDAFEIQLIDGIAPADITPGTGIDDRSVSSQSVLLLKDNLPLIEGVDYRYGYNPSTNVIRLTPIAGVFEENSTYVIRMVDASDAIVSASAGNSYVDGSRLNLIDLSGQTTTFEYETGLVMTINAATTGETADGFTLDVFDGSNTLLFELDNNGSVDPSRIGISIPQLGDADQIASAIANTLSNAAGLNLTVNVDGNRVQLLGSSPLATVATNTTSITTAGQIGTSIGYGIQIPAEGARPAATIQDGQTFIVSRGSASSVTFELDTNNQVDTTGATAVRFSANATLDQIADAIVRAVGGAGLGLAPSNVGFGRVLIGGDANYSIDLTGSTLQQTEVPGAEATIPVVIPIDQDASEVAQTIAAAIGTSGLAGVATSVVDTRVFIEGTGGVSGTGAVDLITIRDEVGNELQSNQANGRTELTIFVGSGFDYGDAPSPYASLQSQGGPRHAVDPTLSFGPTVDADADAEVLDGDNDDGIVVASVLQAGFSTNVSININADAGRTFYVDAWFDWDADGQFEVSERLQFGSAGTGRSVLGVGTNTISVNVPAFAANGETYARFRLSESDSTGPTGDATSGEVEDVRLLIGSNPFQNPAGRLDVNGDGNVTPIDAFQIVNALNRAGGNIDLSITPTPSGLPRFPDVNADGRVTPSDAFAVINALSLGTITGGGAEGEQIASNYVPTANGVFASSATVLGDRLMTPSTITSDPVTSDPVATAQPESTIDDDEDKSTSVFDHASVVQLEGLMDDLAADAVQRQDDSSEDSTSVLDRLFAQL